MPKRTILLLIVMFSILNSLQGQIYRSFEFEQNEIIEKTRFRIGPFRLFPRIMIQEFGHDDNVYRNTSDPVSDITFDLALDLKTALLFRDNLILSLSLAPEYVYFHEQADLRGWYRTYFPSLKWRFLHRLIFTAEYTNTTGRRRPSFEFDERVNFSTKGYFGSVFYEFSGEAAIGFTYQKETYRYESITDPGVGSVYTRRLNRAEDDYSVGLYYPVFSASRFFIDGGYTDYVFEFAEAKVKNSVSYQILTGIEFPVVGRIRGTLSLGYKKFIPREEELKGFSGLVGNTALNYRISRYAFRVVYARNIPLSFYSPNTIFYTEDRVGGGASFYLSRIIRLDYDYRNGRLNYPEKSSVTQPGGDIQEIARRDIMQSHRGGIVFRLYSNTGVGFYVDIIKRDSNVLLNNFENTFIGLYLIYDF